MAIHNITVLRSGKSEVSTAVDYGYSEIHVRKGPDGIDSTIVLSVAEAQYLIRDLQAHVRSITNLRSTLSEQRIRPEYVSDDGAQRP